MRGGRYHYLRKSSATDFMGNIPSTTTIPRITQEKIPRKYARIPWK
jgi:hypothetical protein